MRSTHGQATIDYVALVGVLAIVFGTGLGFATGAAASVVNAVSGQIRHALCVVGGGRCLDFSARPCIVAGRRDAHHVAVNIALLRADHDRYVLRERMSDGTVRLTVAHSSGLGAEIGLGGAVRAGGRGRRVNLSNQVRVGAQGVFGSGQVFVARDERAADALVHAIRSDRERPQPREVFVDGGVRGLGRIGIGSVVAEVSLEALTGTIVGVRRNRETGDTTFALGAAGSAWGGVTAALGAPLGLAEDATTLALTLDRERRPRELSLSAAGVLSTGMTLPPVLARALGDARQAVSGLGGRRWELGARLDLRDPAVAATWARFRGDPLSADTVRALGQAISDRAQFDARIYRAENSSSRGGGAGLALGVRLGAEYEHTVDRYRLLAASSRPPGGLWELRADCMT